MIIGLTGGIGSGKSTVAKLFEIIGCPVFYADIVAKQLYFDNQIKEQVIALLGSNAYCADNQINKKYISDSIFSNARLLKELNAIIHPAVANKFEQFKIQNHNKLIIKETALLFEASLEASVDKIILVVAHDNLRISRVMLRDSLTKEEVISKIKNQMTQQEKILKSHFIIYNNEEDFLIKQVLNVYSQLTQIK